MPDTPPRQTPEEIEETINPGNEVDEASLESFPASDPPAFAGSHVGPADVPAPDADEDPEAGGEEA
jgi:hypothetical protein